jgi:hypothetical protein
MQADVEECATHMRRVQREVFEAEHALKIAQIDGGDVRAAG